MSNHKDRKHRISRRTLLKGIGCAPFLYRPAPLHGLSALGFIQENPHRRTDFAFADVRLVPHYPAPSPLTDVLRLVPAGSDEYITEKYAHEIESILKRWSEGLVTSIHDVLAMARSFGASIDQSIQASSLMPDRETVLRSGEGIDSKRRSFGGGLISGRDRFLQNIQAWIGRESRVEIAEFEITGIQEISSTPLKVRADIRYDIVVVRKDGGREERVGTCRTDWTREQSDLWNVQRWEAVEEVVAFAAQPFFVDVSPQAFAAAKSYPEQMLRGAEYWRTVLDGACGIDVYGNNGVAAGDFDSDGFDDLYVCQPAGLPNRLYRNRGDGTFEDVTEKAGVGVLDGTACALFADFDNKGVQDLLVVCGAGPLLFQNQGNGTFSLKRDAFQFKTPPQGTFAHAAIADYDRDGRLDIYFCLYSYYVGLDQYHYPVPYFDARNGPPNFLMHNEGNGTFVDKTAEAGLNAENDRYSFACAWGSINSGGFPDLYVANDFGRGNLYRNNGDGRFAAVSAEDNVQDVGAGMSASWSDFDNDGNQEIYSANMWSAAGQRVAAQKSFHEKSSPETLALYRRHARGNALYQEKKDGKFKNISQEAGVEMGRWSWCSDSWDFDHDGYPDLYVANGYISAPDRGDLSSFFWRQVVGKSPDDAAPTPAYEHGWQAINELIRSDSTWNGYERNVMFANNRDGTFSEVSGIVGLDFPEDGRSFALADIDHDGRLEVILKNRNAPQLRILHNSRREIGHSISFRLRGTKSNRDAIGAAITLESGALRQTKYLQAGSGFLAQHSKELFFGIGNHDSPVNATIHWPSGVSQSLPALPVNHRIEVEEGSSAFTTKAFAETPAAYAQAGLPPEIEPLPSVIDTWLIEPLKAPEFSLPDLSGKPIELRSFAGSFLLLNFWSSKAPICLEQLKLLDRNRAALTARKLNVLAINVDDASGLAAAQSLVARNKLSVPVLFATVELAGIYNIVYRYLFDRRRDLPIPASFLVDESGMIVKIYQGPIDPQHLHEDVKSAPTTAAERLKRAIPFGGSLYQGRFQRNEFTYGVAMFQHGYLEQAEKSFEQVIAATPDDPEAYYNLGTLKLRKNEFQPARQYLEQTLKLKPDYPEAWNNLGMMAAQQGSADEAIQDFQQSLLLRPGYAIALLNLGNVYRRQGSFDKARQSLSQALALQPDDAEINYSLGMLYAQQSQMQQASSYLERAIDLRPDYPEALNNLGILFVRQQDYAKAEEQFQSCIRLVPAFDQSYLNLARVYAVQNDKQKARDVLFELLRIQPQNAGAKQMLGMLQ